MTPNVEYFDPKAVQALRERAERARHLGEPKGPGGWRKSELDPMRLLGVFESLRLAPGYVLRAYQYESGSGGNGVVWAMPADAPFPEPAECLHSAEDPLSSPRPPEALDDLMEVLEGDGTPWSYVSASLFGREVKELGALWHGCAWSDVTLVGEDPWSAQAPSAAPEHTPSPPDHWEWDAPPPSDWRPRLERSGAAPTVVVHVYDPVGQESIRVLRDEYEESGYRFRTLKTDLAHGPGGIVY